LRYQVPVAVNPVINGAFDIWQRGTSIATAAGTNNYSADRWIAYRGEGGATISRQATGDTTNLPNIQYSARIQRDSGNSSTNPIWFVQPMETTNSIPYAGQSVVFSFWARAGANYSATSSALAVNLYSGTGTDQNYVAAYTGAATQINQSATLTTTWQRFTYTATVGATATELAMRFTFTPVGTASTNDWFEVTGVQLERGSVATPFRRSGGTIQGELAACQRYYFRTNTASTNTYFALGSGYSSTVALFVLNPPVPFRAKPTVLEYSTLNVTDTVTSYSITALSFNEESVNTVGLTGTVSSGLTGYRPYFLKANASTSAYIGVGAEL
jgi:hypothetical protein